MTLRPRRASPEERRAILMLEETGFVGPELTDYFLRRWGEERREQQDRRPIRVDASLTDLLNGLPAPWIHAIGQQVGGEKRSRKRDEIPRIAARLKDPGRLREIVTGLPLDARLALVRVLERGGWMPLADLEWEFGSIEGDGWFWEDHPPKSLLGQLRVRGLLFVGRARAGRRHQTVAVAPKDLREPLALLLQDPTVLPPEARSRTATTRAIGRLTAFYATLKDPLLPLEDLTAFLQSVRPREALDAEEDVEDLLLAMGELELKSADDLSGHHLSIWMHLLRYLYVGEVPLARKRRMLRTTARLYRFLAKRGRVMAITAERIEQAVAEMTAPARGLQPILPPPPMGGEVIMRIWDPEGNVHRLTMNDRWLVIACAALFQGDWEAMEREAAMVQDGARKQERIRWLRRSPPAIWRELLSFADPEDVDFAREWFYNHEMSELSVW